MADKKEYLFDKFIDQPDKTPQEAHTDAFNKFVKDYSVQLRDIEDALDEGFGEVWDAVQDPIKFDYEPFEPMSFADLLKKTDNKVLFKIILVMSHLSWEMTELKQIAQDKFFPALAMFGYHGEEELKDGDVQLQFGRSINLLMDLWNYCERVNLVVQNCVRQLAALYSSKKRHARLKAFSAVHFQGVFSCIADILGVLITIDELIAQNDNFKTFITMYKRMVRKIMDEPETFGLCENDSLNLRKINFLLEKIEGDLMEGLLLDNCVNRSFDDDKNGIEVSNNKEFKMEFEHNLKNYFYYLTSNIGTAAECEKRYQFVGFCGLYVFYFQLFRDTSNKKLFKEIWDIHKKLPIIHLYGNTIWSPSSFLFYKVEDMVRACVKNPQKEISEVRKNSIKNFGLGKQVNLLYMHLCVWMSRIESTFSVESEGQDVIGIEGTLILQGLHLAYQISNLMKTAIFLHIVLDEPLKTKQVAHLCKCIEMVKAIQNTYHRKGATIASLISVIAEFLAYKIQRLLLPLKNRLETKKSPTDVETDQLSSVILALQLLRGAPTRKRILLVRQNLCVALQRTQGLIRESDFEEVRGLLRRLDLIANFESTLKYACDCSFIYWSRPMIHTFFKHVYECPERAQELMYMFEGLHDPAPMLLSACHLPNNKVLLDAYKKEIEDSFQANIIMPLCQEIETDLRLHIHTVVLGQQTTHLSSLKGNMKDLSIFFKIRPLRFFGNLIEITSRVSRYLDTTFYNLTTIAMHDWKTYEEMRNLAQEKYGLALTNVYLPGQTLEQGLDVLEITRNIHIFVANFSYNLNNNMFLERCSATDAKNLNSIHIRHVANSIRTHGTGIMNTTVNFVYQFLGRKFFIFSQFLYDDHIKSRLIKDIAFYKENQAQLDNKYPIKRTEKFTKDIRRLGVTEQGLSYLDQFRNLITEIGNALGYVRMVRSGGLRYISEAIKFVPDLENIENFEELVRSDNLSEETAGAAKNLDSVITNLNQKFAEGSDYFKILEQVFTAEMQKEQNKHLKNFYIIVPPLTMSFVEYMMISKDKMIKKGKEASFSDDGFALGLAFILKILSQNSQFDSLHWFESVRDHYREEYIRVEAEMRKIAGKSKLAGKKDAADEIQTMKLTLNRFESYLREFELLFFSFSGSRVFFRD